MSAALRVEGDGQRLSLFHGGPGEPQGLIEAIGHDIDVLRIEAPPDPVRVRLDDDGHAFVHGDGQRLGAAHPAQPGGEDEPPLERPAEMPPGGRGQGLVGPLEDPLGPDVDPAAGGHLSVHGQAHGLEPPELVPGRPLGDDEGVGDEDPGGLVMGREHGHGLAGLNDERLVVAERLEGFDDRPIAIPVAGGPSRSPVDDEVPRLLGHIGIEVVHQHP